MQNGEKIWVDINEYDTSQGICLWPDRFFEKIVQSYFEIYSIQARKVGNANTYLIDGKSLVEFAIPIMIKESKNASRSKDAL